ncbi:MAG: S8 family serine peptidase [Clostridiales bacterium]|nr:S8 family serine peptidase [Clostridiales bacterium]
MFKKIISALLCIFLAFAVMPFTSAAKNENKKYIVSLKSDADIKRAEELISSLAGVEIEYRFESLLKGFSIIAAKDSADKIRDLFYVNVVEQAQKYQLFEDTTADDEYENSEIESGTADTETELSGSPRDIYRGEGQLVAVIDSGFNIQNSCWQLTESGEAAAKLDASAVTEEGLNAESALYISSKLPFVYDYYGGDSDVSCLTGHGNNIAGMIAANGAGIENSFQGIAPEAQLMLMKVFDDSGTFAYEGDIIAALEDAYLLGADVINLSFGRPCGSDDGSPIEQGITDAINALWDADVMVVCAAGNSGRTGKGSYYDKVYGEGNPTVRQIDSGTIAAPASLPTTTAVGAVFESENYTPVFKLAGGIDIKYTDTNPDYIGKYFAAIFDTEALEYVVVEGIGTEADIAASPNLEGKLALIARGEITFTEKCNNAAAAGAVGVIIYDPEKGAAAVNMALDGAVIPAISISYDDAMLMLNSEKKAVYISLGKFAEEAEIKKYIWAKSSWGTTGTLSPKPDIAARGVHVNTLAYLDGITEYVDGTSIAAAQVSGAYLLLSQYLDEYGLSNAQNLKAILCGSADIIPTDDSVASYSPRVVGTGLLNIDKMFDYTTVLTSNSVSSARLGGEIGCSFDIPVTITNNSGMDVEYQISADITVNETYRLSDRHELDKPEDDVVLISSYSEYIDGTIRVGGGSLNINLFDENYSPDTILVKAHSSNKVILRVLLNEAQYEELNKIYSNGWFVEGRIYLSDVENNLRCIPYVGFVGDIESVRISDSNGYYDLDESYAVYDGNLLISELYIPDKQKSEKIILGSNYFDRNLAPAARYCAVSPNFDGNADKAYLILNLNRNISFAEFSIYDEEGNEVYHDTSGGPLLKTIMYEGLPTTYYIYIWDCIAPDNSNYTYPDGKYTVKFTLISEGGTTQIESYEFVIDKEAPEIISSEVIERNGKRLLKLNIYDNHEIMAVEIKHLVEKSVPARSADNIYDITDEVIGMFEEFEVINEGGYTATAVEQLDLVTVSSLYDKAERRYTVNEDGSLSFEFDITDLNGEKLYIYAYDYAFNRVVSMIRFDYDEGLN